MTTTLSITHRDGQWWIVGLPDTVEDCRAAEAKRCWTDEVGEAFRRGRK